VLLRAAVALAGIGLVAPIPTPIGRGPRYHPGAGSPATAAARPVDGLRCTRGSGERFGIHLELFANRRVVIVPAGIGIAPPVRRDGAYVVGGRCSYPIRTREPTGVFELHAGRSLTLGQLFAVWGRTLAPSGLLSFRGRVSAFVAGRRWLGDPRRIPLPRHAQIVVEVGGYVPPHASFLFRPGL